MGTLGTSVRSSVRNLIANKNIRTSITLTPITRAKGSSGGHGAVTETPGTPRTIYGVPSDYVSEKVEMLKFGDLRTGEVLLLIRDDETFDTNDKVTFDSQDYDIKDVQPAYYNDVVVGRWLVLSEKLS